jgi:coproporphyrinogen III oxidase
VHGKLPEAMQKLFNVGEADFACGLSLVLHPKPNGTYGTCKLALF